MAASLLAGCARNAELHAWTSGLQKAERSLEQKNYDSAIRQFKALQQTALSDFDSRLALMRQAESYRRAGKLNKSENLLFTLLRSRDSIDREQRAKIAYKHARVVIENKREAQGESLMKQVTQVFPNTIFGHRAFTYLRGRITARDPSLFAAYCREQYKKSPNSELADNYLYEAGLIYFNKKTPKDDIVAAQLYKKVLDNWHFQTSALWDDAIWDLSLIRHRQKRFKDELHLLRELISTREFTTWIGSYEIRNYKYAALRIGKLYYLKLKDYQSAAKVFKRFGKDFSESRYLDDALWWQGHSLLKSGQKDEAKVVFEQLLAEYPESKYARRVRNGDASP